MRWCHLVDVSKRNHWRSLLYWQVLLLGRFVGRRSAEDLPSALATFQVGTSSLLLWLPLAIVMHIWDHNWSNSSISISTERNPIQVLHKPHNEVT